MVLLIILFIKLFRVTNKLYLYYLCQLLFFKITNDHKLILYSDAILTKVTG